MKENVILCCKLTKEIPNIDGEYIGVDKGCLYLYQKGIKNITCIGDFDSISQKNLKLLEKENNIIKYSKNKDYSDSYLALKYVSGKYKNIYLLGSTSKRIDHLLNNIFLLKEFKNDNIKIIDKYNEISYISDKTIELTDFNYKYISVFPLKNSILTLEGFKYPLKNKHLKAFDTLVLSNEIKTKPLIKIKGEALLIKSND